MYSSIVNLSIYLFTYYYYNLIIGQVHISCMYVCMYVCMYAWKCLANALTTLSSVSIRSESTGIQLLIKVDRKNWE